MNKRSLSTGRDLCSKLKYAITSNAITSNPLQAGLCYSKPKYAATP